MSATHVPRWRELYARIERNTKIALERAAVEVQREIKLQLNKHKSPPPSAPGSPPGNLTGTLGRSVQIDRSQINRFRIRIGPGVKYARIHEYGGTIVPKRVRFLRWKGQDGRWHFARRVVLPARPYMRPAARAARQRVEAQFTSARLLRA